MVMPKFSASLGFFRADPALCPAPRYHVIHKQDDFAARTRSVLNYVVLSIQQSTVSKRKVCSC